MGEAKINTHENLGRYRRQVSCDFSHALPKPPGKKDMRGEIVPSWRGLSLGTSAMLNAPHEGGTHFIAWLVDCYSAAIGSLNPP